MFSSLEKSVLSVIVYFDIFDYPLTLMEVYRYLRLEVRCKMLDVRRCLEELSHKGLVMSLPVRQTGHEGFYYLKGRRDIIKLRKERYNIAERKYRRVLWVVRILKMIPFVRMIAVCNNLAYSNAREASDIDLFIVAKRGRIWCCRFFVLMILKVLGLRPKVSDTRDKICASFFVTDDNLNLEKIKIDDDVYLQYWIEQVVPIYDDGVHDRFREANLWSGGGFGLEMVGRRRLSDPPSLRLRGTGCSIARLLKRGFEKLFLDIDEKFYRWLQMKIMPSKLKELASQGGSEVVINDQMLKFHENDRRGYYRDLFTKRLHEYVYE